MNCGCNIIWQRCDGMMQHETAQHSTVHASDGTRTGRGWLDSGLHGAEEANVPPVLKA